MPGPLTQRLGRAFVGLLVLGVSLLVGCSTEDAAPSASAEATVAAETATPSRTPWINPNVRPPSTPTHEPTPAPPPSDLLEPGESDLSGDPYSTSDVRHAVVHAGYTFWESRENIERVERPALCPVTSVPEFPFWAASWLGSDFGPILVLWIYPTIEAREAEWVVTSEGAIESRLGCELPTEYAWVNENAVLIFRTWVSAGDEYLDHLEPPSVFPPVEAFRALAPVEPD